MCARPSVGLSGFVWLTKISVYLETNLIVRLEFRSNEALAEVNEKAVRIRIAECSL